MRTLHLLTSKPVMYVANVAEDELADALADPDGHAFVRQVRELAAAEGAETVIVSARSSPNWRSCRRKSAPRFWPTSASPSRPRPRHPHRL